MEMELHTQAVRLARNCLRTLFLLSTRHCSLNHKMLHCPQLEVCTTCSNVLSLPCSRETWKWCIFHHFYLNVEWPTSCHLYTHYRSMLCLKMDSVFTSVPCKLSLKPLLLTPVFIVCFTCILEGFLAIQSWFSFVLLASTFRGQIFLFKLGMFGVSIWSAVVLCLP